MEPLPEQTPEERDLVDQLVRKVRNLENKLADAESQQQKYAQEVELLSRERLVLEKDYETLRLQKGGFGFKILILSGFLGFLTGIVICYLFLRPTSKHAEVFSDFQHATQFHVEYAIGQGDFVQAEELLKKSAETRDYKLIEPEIEMMRKIVSAAKRQCE